MRRREGPWTGSASAGTRTATTPINPERTPAEPHAPAPKTRSRTMPDRMKDVHPVPRGHDPLAADLTPADDRILLNHWLPPQEGIVPRVRIGRRWISVLWALPIAAVALM